MAGAKLVENDARVLSAATNCWAANSRSPAKAAGRKVDANEELKHGGGAEPNQIAADPSLLLILQGGVAADGHEQPPMRQEVERYRKQQHHVGYV
jgi:hypothetical protein